MQKSLCVGLHKIVNGFYITMKLIHRSELRLFITTVHETKLFESKNHADTKEVKCDHCLQGKKKYAKLLCVGLNKVLKWDDVRICCKTLTRFGAEHGT